MKAKERIIIELANAIGAADYLEVGVAAGFCLSHIKMHVENCVGVEPDEQAFKKLSKVRAKGSTIHNMTSDEFFSQNKNKYDIILIDGLHHADQVEKDIINAWYALKPNGFILLHDVHPPTEEHQIVPRKQESWTGDVWKAFIGFREAYPKIDSGCIEEKYGLGWIKKKPRTKVEPGFVLEEEFTQFDPSRLGYDQKTLVD